MHPGYGMPSGLQGMTGMGILGIVSGSGSAPGPGSHNDASVPSETSSSSSSAFLPLALPGRETSD